MKNQEERIEILVREKLEGKSYTEIRASLLDSGLSKEEISDLIRKVDEKVLEETLRGNRMEMPKKIYRAGLILAITGLIISILFNAGLILTNTAPLIVYTPFLLGILLMFYGRMARRREPPAADTGPGPIRRRRPFK